MMKRWMAVLAMAALVIVLPQPARALNTADALALVAMPLVVAEVANMNNVPMPRLMDVVSMLNAASVPPPQFIEVVRYVPVALVTDVQQPNRSFVQYVQTQYDSGLRGPEFGTVVVRQLRTYDLPVPMIVDLQPPQILEIVDAPVPPVVWTRVAQYHPVYVPSGNQYLAPQRRYYPQPGVTQTYVPPPQQAYYPPPQPTYVPRTEERDWSNHPHGGPPGQLKKQYGYQTGAEVVHGYKPGKGQNPGMAQRPVVVPRPMPTMRPQQMKGHGNGKGHGKHQAYYSAPQTYAPARYAAPRRYAAAQRTVAPRRWVAAQRVAPRRVTATQRVAVRRPAYAPAAPVRVMPVRAAARGGTALPWNGRGRGKH